MSCGQNKPEPVVVVPVVWIVPIPIRSATVVRIVGPTATAKHTVLTLFKNYFQQLS
jgi:hypothetical protein